jgi:ABC-2 type transport system ATP-binding protein
MTDHPIIEMRDVRKTYATVEALRGFDLHVPPGAICGFLGRNGAGKTTALQILLGMTHPDGGEARVFGLHANDPRASVEIRRRAAFVSEEKQLYPSMSVEQMIRFTAPFFPRWRADLERRYIQRFALPLDRKVKALSLGMRAKLALLLALCRGAELLILDEPTSGLDPAVAEEVLQSLITHVADEGMTVLFASHHIAEVEQIADRVTIIDRGRNVVSGALDDLRESYRHVQIVFADDVPDGVSFDAAGAVSVRRNGRRVLTVLCSAGPDRIVEEARALGAVSIDVVPVSLKEIFLATVATED